MNPHLPLLFAFFLLIRGSDASFPDDHFRFALSEVSPQSKAPAPGPGPSSVTNRKFSGGAPKSSPTPAIPPFTSLVDGFTTEKCNSSYNTCHDLENMTACLLFAEHAVVEQYLLIQNDGETSMKVNIIISNAKYKEIKIPEHHAKKVNISDVPGNSMITLEAGNGKCMIHVGLLTKSGSILKKISFYLNHLNLVSGSYLLFAIVLIIGGVWACCNMGTKERHADGVPYQELELAEHDSSPTNDLEAAEGWDQGWDDDWDESKSTNKSSAQMKANGSSNGLNSKTSDRDGWGNDWDD
ncbi:uncharacterized protein LOC111006692 [Momordica charantia]|uniref:Uncharacterized protein LOC111006692 n=1 Tax=Momordica charantia TaxID=3673 RepID=A0A6J1C206_MOMCH|nr:uncharacterized protein LOC111006692 [Momordica charantia]